MEQQSNQPNTCNLTMTAQYLWAGVDEVPEDAALITKAVGGIARARGMMELARASGTAHDGLYKALGDQGNPALRQS